MKEKSKRTTSYESPEQDWWQGRNDGDQPDQLRWWQHIQLRSLAEDLPDFRDAPVIVGFACDEGVARNKGRIGSAEGPLYLRKALSDLPIRNAAVSLFDVGTIHCVDTYLEEAQAKLSEAIQEILKSNGFPILLGGGHETLYGNYAGTAKHFEKKKVGIINFDAHFDIRKPGSSGISSGTGFYQVAADSQNEGKDFLYLAIGIQHSGNTTELFKRADALKAEYVLDQDFHSLNLEKMKEQVQRFLAKTDVVCLAVDLDVFSASIAPGVSAPSAVGIFYDYTFREIMKLLAANEKVVSLDIAEYNPRYYIDSRTAKLAAELIFDWINWKFN
ncbi:MAG: formimidoylglutamase [Bacteroidia bacterium]|nr:formimidoylglutamase [Bacteroidia bacterium]